MGATVSFATVRKLGLQLPNVEEVTMYGKPALKVGGKMFVCLAAHKSAEPGSLVVRTDLDQRTEMLAADPYTYYVTDHYRGYPAVLVRLSRVTPDMLRDLVNMAYRFVLRESTRSAKQKRLGSARSRTE
jgi:hypothetical protein